MSEIEKLKIIRGDRSDYQCTLVSILANEGESSSFNHALRVSWSREESSDFVASESALSRDCVRSVSAETKSDQSLPKSNTNPLYDLDPKIEITLHRLRKARNIVVSNSTSFNSVSSSDNSSPVTNDSDSFKYSSTNNSTEPEQIENNDQTLKELAMLDVKSGLIHLLPKFYGLAREDPHKHLKEFHVVCSTMRSQGVSEDYIKMKAFPFCLDGVAKDWLYLQPVVFNTLEDMKSTFLEKFFQASRTSTIRKEICGIRQHSGETLHEYWERFNKLCATCSHHQIREKLLIQYFYEDLTMMDRSMIDADSGEGMNSMVPSSTIIAMEEQQWFTINSQDTEDRAHHSALAYHLVPSDNLRLPRF
ncbi:hypothetical protein CR513_39209, partial [Mucuna pruriens]